MGDFAGSDYRIASGESMDVQVGTEPTTALAKCNIKKPTTYFASNNTSLIKHIHFFPNQRSAVHNNDTQ